MNIESAPFWTICTQSAEKSIIFVNIVNSFQVEIWYDIDNVLLRTKIGTHGQRKNHIKGQIYDGRMMGANNMQKSIAEVIETNYQEEI